MLSPPLKKREEEERYANGNDIVFLRTLRRTQPTRAPRGDESQREREREIL